MADPIPKQLFARGVKLERDQDKDWYYAFLTDLEPLFDQNGVQTDWDVAFELAPKGWMDLQLLSYQPESWSVPKDIPQILFHVGKISDADLRTLLGISNSKEQPTERQWYLIQLVDGGSVGVEGDFYNLLET